MRKIRPGIEKYYDSVIYAPSYIKFKKFLHNSHFDYYQVPIKIKRLELFTKLFKNLSLPFSPKEEFRIKDYDIYPVAQTHLDAAWLWSVNDTKVRAYKTFYAALKHIDRYPYFSVSMTTPQYFNWIRRYDPEIWLDVKEQVAKNKIDICGGMWVEPALRLCSGEALVRQRLYGQLYYLRNFGKISKVESLLDVFGFPYSLPQILVKSGAESFWTTKLTWNDHSDFPFSNYIWRGLDGSEIFTHMFKFQIMSRMDFGLYKKMARRPKDKGFVFNSSNSLKEMEDSMSDDHVRTLGWFYGKGDGGKGPIFTEIQYMENLTKYYGNFSKGFKHTNTHRYFEILKEDVGDQIVTWDDEMYLEYHRGCLTTQSQVKRGNRQSEELTIAAEILKSMMILAPSFKGYQYPKELFDDCWQKILFNQFHDILPGSSIPEVYLLTWKEHDFVIHQMQELLKSSLSQIDLALPSKKGDIVLYNPVPVKNDVVINDENNEYLVKNVDPLTILIINRHDLRKWDEKLNKDILVKTHKSSITVENEFLEVEFSKKSGNLIGLNLNNQRFISNFLYGERNDVQESTEKLVLKDNTIKKHQLKFKGARITAYKEPMSKGQGYPAWNIDREYKKYPIAVESIKNPKVEYLGSKVTVTSYYAFKKSQIELTFTIRAHSEIVDVDFNVDLQDKKTLLKYFLPLNLNSENIRCEIPYGSIKRSRNPKSEMEEGKWEFGMQKWVDVSDSDVGLAVLNDSKYGVSANMKGVSITLVRSPHYPKDPFHTREIKFKPRERPNYTDLGKHQFALRLVPHKDTWIEARIPHKALAFNNPVFTINSKENFIESESIAKGHLSVDPFQNGGLEGHKCLLPKITSDHPFVIVSTLKPSEWVSSDSKDFESKAKYSYEDYDLLENPEDWIWDKKTIIVRAYEWAGAQISTTLRFHNLSETMEFNAEEIDLLEYKIGKKLKVARNLANKTTIIHLNFTPHEIKTIRLTISNK